MKKPKHPLFVTAAVILLLIIGTWVTSAQATNAGFMDATTTPTAMPFGTPNTPSGDIPSVEEQEALKATVQAYFEIRYRALSVVSTKGLAQDSFGSLVSETPQAAAFLSEEMSKLAVEIERADTYHLRYVNYKYSLDFHSITVDSATQTATILMTEGNEVVYEISAELNPEDPIISYTAGIEHTILLYKTHDQWKIISDTYNDDLWKMLRHGGKSTEEMLRTADEMQSVLEAAPKSLITRQARAEALPAYTLPDDPSSHPYDRAGAVEYALRHWNGQAGKYNPDYFVFPDNDCQNFVSQALYEGGNATMYIPDPNNLGVTGWYYLNDGLEGGPIPHQSSDAWKNVINFFQRTTLTDPAILNTAQENWPETWRDAPYNAGPEGVLIGTLNSQVDNLNNVNNIPAGLQLGDVIQYEWGKSDANPDTDSEYDHTAIVVAMDNGFPFIAAHTDDHYGIPYTQTVNPIQEVRFIHIERSNGYPPVHTKITAAADDASRNPLPTYNCNGLPATSPGYNEIYLGNCANGSQITAGLRFKDVQIPRGAFIKYAFVTFTVDGIYSNPVTLQIAGDASVAANAFPSPPLETHAMLGTPVSWNITDTWTLGQRRITPNITSVLQEIVAQPTWAYGNSLVLLFRSNGTGSSSRRVIAFERGQHSPAKLTVAYSYLPGPNLDAPTVYSVTRLPIESNGYTNAASVVFAVQFSKPVTGVDINDFSLTL